jgi:hypothetical protein
LQLEEYDHPPNNVTCSGDTLISSLETPSINIAEATTETLLSFSTQSMLQSTDKGTNTDGHPDALEVFATHAGGRSKGDIRTAKLKLQEKKMAAITLAAMRLFNKQSLARLHGNTFQKDHVNKSAANLNAGKLAIRHNKEQYGNFRVGQQNLTGVAKYKISPHESVEQLLVENCLKLSNNRRPLTKFQILSLAESLIDSTDLKDNMISFKRRHKILGPGEVARSVGMKAL